MHRIYSLIVILFVCNMLLSQTKHYKYKQQIDSIITNDTTPWRYQLCAFDYSEIGEYRLALETWDEPRIKFKNPPLKEDLANQFLKHQPVRADRYIVEQARQTGLLIINEAHHQPRQLRWIQPFQNQAF